MNIIKVVLLFIISFLIFFSCANQLPPSGGPKDNEPPEIIEFYPENGTLNYNDDKIEITFSEYIDKFSLLDAVFISPEIKRLDYSWTGTTVTITFDDTLTENTTYTIAVGSNVKDLNNKNPMAEATNISFSTGDKIDIGTIDGQIYDADLTGIMIFAYSKKDSFESPVLKPSKNITQIGENGKYKLLGLRNGTYRLFAIKDESGNRIYNIGDDRFGVASELVILTDSSQSFSDIDFRITKEDTIPPYITNITMTDLNHLSVEFSEALDTSKINSSNFTIFDSLSGSKYLPEYFYSGNIRKHEYFLSYSDSLINSDKYFLLANSIVDNFGNVNLYDSYNFAYNSKSDTLAPTVQKVITPFNNNSIDYLYPSFQILFSDAIAKSDLSIALIFDRFDWKLNRITDALFEVRILNELSPKESFDFKIDFNKITDATGNTIDSIQTFTLNTISDREFSGLSGTIYNPNKINNIVVELNNIDSKRKSYKSEAKNGKYSFDRVLPGKYTILLFEDRDKDMEYNYGRIEPFKFSEKFFNQPDTLNLRARWPVGDYELKAVK